MGFGVEGLGIYNPRFATTPYYSVRLPKLP